MESLTPLLRRSARWAKRKIIQGEQRARINRLIEAADHLGRKSTTIAPKTQFYGPVIFVGQREYFRQAYYDWVADGDHYEFNVTYEDQSRLVDLPSFARKVNAKTCVVFRPEWFSQYLDTFAKLKNMGVGMVGYSTEPVPQRLDDPSIHPDQITRLESLINALKLDYDLIVHFDILSKDILQQLGFRNVSCWPLPVSTKLFYPEQLAKRFDICFLGRSTDHREKFMGRLKARFDLVHIAHGLNDEDARDFMNRSKLVLNIHNMDYINFETRVIQALLCQRPLLSEKLPWNYLTPNRDFIEFSSPESLYEKSCELLIGGGWEHLRISIADLSPFHLDTMMKQIGYVGLEESQGTR